MQIENNQQDNPYQSPKSNISLQTETSSEYSGKVYSVFAIAIGTLFGSVLAAGLLIYSNYSHFKQDTKALTSVLLTIFATIIFLFLMLLTQNTSFLFYLATNFIFAVLIFPLVMILQGSTLEQHEDNGKPFHSSVRAGLIGMGCLIAMLIMITFAYFMFLMFIS